MSILLKLKLQALEIAHSSCDCPYDMGPYCKHEVAVGPMLHKVATIGTGMAIFVTFVWLIMISVADQKVKAVSNEVKVDA